MNEFDDVYLGATDHLRDREDEPRHDDEDGDCWFCHGEGGFHDCGEDTCCCLDQDEITVECPECGGEG